MSSTHGKSDIEMKASSEQDLRTLLPSSQQDNRLMQPLNLSLLLNVVLVICLTLFATQQHGTPSSPLPVAPNACSSGAVTDLSRESCNGNGMLFADAEVCTCFDCWTGDSCSVRLTGEACMVDASSGTPYIFEKWWVDHPAPTLTVAPSYHLGYGSEMPRLDSVIRQLHALVGNAQTDGRRIVVGVGSTELISSAMFALASVRSEKDQPSAIWSRRPYYSGRADPHHPIPSRPHPHAIPSRPHPRPTSPTPPPAPPHPTPTHPVPLRPHPLLRLHHSVPYIRHAHVPVE